MARGASSSSSNASRLRKRVDAEDASSTATALKRARDGSAFARCEGCNKDVAVALISFHDCGLDAKIKMNLEAQVVEMATEAKKKPVAERKKAKSTEPKAKKEKDPNARKRPPTAFFVFMEEFRKTFKEANPDCKSVATVAKDAGAKWKSMTDEEKKVYIDIAAERKAEYDKALESDEAENQQEVDDSSDKQVKNELEDELTDDESSEKKAKEEIEDDLDDE